MQEKQVREWPCLCAGIVYSLTSRPVAAPVTQNMINNPSGAFSHPVNFLCFIVVPLPNFPHLIHFLPGLPVGNALSCTLLWALLPPLCLRSSSLRRTEFGDGGSEAGLRVCDCDNLGSSGSWAVTKVGLCRGRDCEVRCCVGFGNVKGELLLVLSTGS